MHHKNHINREKNNMSNGTIGKSSSNIGSHHYTLCIKQEVCIQLMNTRRVFNGD